MSLAAVVTPVGIHKLSSSKANPVPSQRLTTRCQAGRGFGSPSPKKSGVGSSQQDEVARYKCPLGNDYAECCGKYHAGKESAEDAALLMRTRYCAYSKNEPDYLVATTHPDSPLIAEKGRAEYVRNVRETCRTLKFLGLEILGAEGGQSDDEAFVTFLYKYKILNNGRWTEERKQKERSRFLRNKDKWAYHSSDMTGV
eukprot:jgi/Mesvir1/19702/Mv09965-RA.1